MPLTPEEVDPTPGDVVRAQLSHLQLFRSIGDGRSVEVIVKATHQMHGRTPSWLAKKLLSFVWPGILRIVGLADMRSFHAMGVQLQQPHLLPAAESIKAHRECRVCLRRFGLVRKRKVCKACFHVACAQCTVQLAFYNARGSANSTSKHGTTPTVVGLDFCLHCVVQVREKRRAGEPVTFRE